ncbi:unnamed protein product [Vicia faba]|uniref:Uncharacterized protein n=1 Tax=Vicia faba TaxID=3906 RepID=A0AAV0ZGL9_VICFA|nr:unnamed protein product [Vicia faba]
MAEIAVSLVIDQLLPLLKEEAKLLRGIDKEFADIKDELECIQAFLKDADKRVSTIEGVKTWVKQVREAAFRIEDIIDDYMILVGQQPLHPGFLSLLHKVKTVIPRRRIASEIQDIKSDVRGIKERSERYGFQSSLEQGPSNSKWHDPRLAALYIEESEFVGFKEPRKRLIDWMVKGRDERTVISVVGMGGQGKTTLAKKVFDSKDVVRHFDIHVWITVSQSYNVEDLLREMLIKFCKQKGDIAPRDISQMDRGSLTKEVRNYLQQKRYIVMFDDVWDVHFWDAIKFAVIDNKNGSRIFITTRNLEVVMSCKESSFVELLELQPLTQEQSLELFNKKAFQFDYGGCCPKELNDIACEIVRKCKGLPLAIVAIGGVLSAKDKNVFEWQKFNENLSLELLKSTHLIGIQEILGLSYDDLPYHLKPCLLYFGIFPEDHIVRSKKVIRQWIAEGFVKEENGKTLEEVAEGYLIELIHRSLVQVSLLRIDGKVKRCRVHDLIREMILEKNEDLNFCKHIISDAGQSSLSGKFRRLSIATTYDFFPHIEGFPVRSLFFFENGEPYKHCKRRIPTPTTYRHQHKILKSIGMLQNLETLEVKGAIRELPKEISKLRKLRHLSKSELSLIQLKDGIGKMTSLQTLRYVDLGMDGVAEVIKELGKLKQLRDLGLVNVRTQDGSILSSSINEMCYLEKLYVSSSMTGNGYDVIDLHLISMPTMLRKLTLSGRLQKLPEWILKLQNLVQLKLMHSYFTIDPIKSLKSLQNLLMLSICFTPCFEELELHFEDGWFQKLKELHVGYVDAMRDIIIDKGALPSLTKLELIVQCELKSIPTGIEHLEKLEVLYIQTVIILSGNKGVELQVQLRFSTWNFTTALWDFNNGV